MNPFVIVCIVVGVAIAGLLILSFVAAMKAIVRVNYPGQFRKDSITSSARGRIASRVIAEAEAFLRVPSEEVYITTDDGHRLCGQLLCCPHKTKGVFICFHGLRSKPEKDYGGQALFLHNLGYDVLLVHQRAHCKSTGLFLTYGVKERFDCLAWIEYVIGRYGKDTHIYLSGQSMGAATVMMASGLELPPSVYGIVADCGFTSPRAIIKFVVNNTFKLPDFPVLYMMDWWCRLLAGFHMNEVSSTESLARSTTPTLFIHGTLDDVVPYSMGLENYEACAAPKKLLTMEGAQHCTCWFYDKELYGRTVAEFIGFCESVPKTV